VQNTKQRHIEAQKAELRVWKKSKLEFDREKVLHELGLLGIDASEVKGKLMDIGGAHGYYASLFSNCSERIVVDPLYETLQQHLDGITGISCGAENIPFPSDSFDFIIVRNVIDHMLDPDKLLSEAFRVLKPGGKIYFMVNIFRFYLKPLFGLMGMLDKPHPLHFTLCDIRRLLTKKTGIRIQRERIARSGRFEWNLKRTTGRIIKMEYYAILCLDGS